MVRIMQMKSLTETDKLLLVLAKMTGDISSTNIVVLEKAIELLLPELSGSLNYKDQIAGIVTYS